MNKTNIEWADYTWNPVYGCERGCKYCYAEKLNKRFKITPDFRVPTFFPDRLGEPYKVKKPSIIFVGSMCDMFGPSVNHEWIESVMKVVKENPHHTFMFLTQRPRRYFDFYGLSLLKNAVLGYTVTYKSVEQMSGIRWMVNIGKMYHVKTFISLEPMLGNFGSVDFKGISLVIAGAMTGPLSKEPVNKVQRQWIDDLMLNCKTNGIPLLIKGSIRRDLGWDMDALRNTTDMKNMDILQYPMSIDECVKPNDI